MCGITGIVRRDGAQIDRELLARMNDAIRHRGPDDDGFYFSDGVGLAMRRLADHRSQDRPAAHPQSRSHGLDRLQRRDLQLPRTAQTAGSAGHTFYTDSDTEAIIHAYDQYGADCPKHLRGMFAFAIWDEREKSLFLARDRVGKKPLLYAHTSDQLIFGSEFTALLVAPGRQPRGDHEAIHHYLSFMCVPAPLTAYQAIRKLEPGHWLLWQNGEIKSRALLAARLFQEAQSISEQEAGERAI